MLAATFCMSIEGIYSKRADSFEAQVTLVEQMILYVSNKSIPKDRGPWLVMGYIVVNGVLATFSSIRSESDLNPVSLAISNYVYSEKVSVS